MRRSAVLLTIDYMPHSNLRRRDRVAELIALGRDREAAELATTAANAPRSPGEPMDVLSQLEQLGPALGGVVGNITTAQLDNPTPCDAYSVRGVLEHMVGGATAFAAAFRAEEATDADTTDVLAAFGPALNDLVSAIASEGALERTVQAPFGEVPGETFARFVVLDGLVHGWDLATATGQKYEPSDELVAAVQDFARDAVPPLRDGVTFADEAAGAVDASPIERLAAFTGRRV
jgi:uncharacterized protein (TIGR03086 family)